MDKEVKSEVLLQTLSAFGKVDNLYYSGTGVAMAFFNKWIDASKARLALNGRLIQGSIMVITWADPDEELDDSDTGRFIQYKFSSVHRGSSPYATFGAWNISH